VSESPTPFRKGLSRRSVVRGAFWALAASATATFTWMVARQSRAWRQPRVVTIPDDVRDAVVFADDVIVCRGDGRVRVFAARCTHLGCRIARVSDGLLVCPCHGSKFRTDGSVAAGPASRPLDPLPHQIDPRTGALTVHVS
jgi:nitrite reductase/ring-hydroxylating ferredoxin subunit